MAGREGKVKQLESQSEQRRLSREELLHPEMFTKDVELGSLGGRTVVIRSISHKERVRIRTECKYGSPEFDEDKFTMKSIVESLVDPKLTESDLEQLAEQDASVIDELIVQIGLINMLGRTDDLKKESDPTPNLDLV
jgi:hypothetical protein